MDNILGIIGGLGPQASAYFYEMITNMTDAQVDQEHINIVLLSHPTIPDRTRYILGKSQDNPYPYLLKDIKTLENLGAKMIAIPCNTSCYFYDELQKNTTVKLNNMVEDAITYIKEQGVGKVAVLATTGTIQSELYQKACSKYNIECEIPNSDVQEKVMSIIYDYVKKGVEVDNNLWEEIISSLNSKYIVLGCTELSYLKKILKLPNNFIDPLEVQARKIITFFGKKVRE